MVFYDDIDYVQMSAVISTNAYCKMLLHALKYPHCYVLGLLIADRQSSSLNIVNVVPVVHDNLSLNITLETALLQVHMSWCIGHVDCRLIHIVNIDHLSLLVSILQMICCEIRRKSYIYQNIIRVCRLDTFACRVAEKVQSYYPDALLVQVQ
jgi:hypothetical protein